MNEEHLEYIRQILPKYLSSDDRESLFSSLKEDFPNSSDPHKLYRELDDKNYYYQGDAIIDIPFSSINIENKKFDLETISGAILSNTCDINSENERLYPPNITLGAIYPLKEFTEYLEATDVKKDKVSSFISNVRNNLISSIFYLPELKNGSEVLLPESFIRFDQTTTLPIEFINDNGRFNKEYIRNTGDRLFSFSNYGFYLFIFKLSVHFCRFREGVFRN